MTSIGNPGVFAPWFLLLHQIPPKPPYFRAKVLRRLNELGALAVKNSAYLLPAGEETLEDLQWVRREIVQEGGEAWLFRTGAVAGFSDETIREAFRKLRAPDYDELAATARPWLERLRASGPSAGDESDFRNLKRRFDEVRRIDFFDAPSREELEDIMNTIDNTLRSPAQETPARPAALQGRIWVTRRGIKVDRIASAWLIRRFIDPQARFRFVDPQNYASSPEHVRFDMFEGEFTHVGNLCTFEVLLDHIGNRDAALQAVAEVVHDIDCKEAKFQRPETAGVASLIDGLVLRLAADEQRLADGSTIFESLYARLGRTAA